jgi:phosphoadenosine phosphosulfate reductase
MLIASPRHTARDLELWTELEQADLICGKRGSVNRRTLRAIEDLLRFVADGPAYAGVSWGKDSTVLAHVLRLAAPEVPLVHLRPTNHNPDCDAVRDTYFARFPGQPYEEIPVNYGDLHSRGLPDCKLDQATDAIWWAAIRESEARYGGRHILGIRADESFGRMIRTARWGISTPNSCAPLARWKIGDIFGYMAVLGLPVHSAYACLGGGRWPRHRLRVAELGDTHGKGSGRREWEQEYYGDELRRIEVPVKV